MNTDHLPERLNWKQACELLGCKKTTLYKLVSAGELPAHGVGKRFRWYSRADCTAYLRRMELQERRNKPQLTFERASA